MTVVVATSLSQALSALVEMPNAQLINGGTDLMVEVNFNRKTPTDVIALRAVPELGMWALGNDGRSITIGAGVPYAQMERGAIADALPALAQAARTVGSPQIRAAGTLGGNLGTCSPAGDALPVLSALDAIVHLQSSSGSREISFHDFMLGVKRNSRAANEIITKVTLPVVTGWQGYSKVGVRNAMVISVASACLVADTLGGSVRLALGAVGPTIIRCRESEMWLTTMLDLKSRTAVPLSVAKEFGARAANESRPIDDHRSTASYRRHAISVLALRLLQQAYPT